MCGGGSWVAWRAAGTDLTRARVVIAAVRVWFVLLTPQSSSPERERHPRRRGDASDSGSDSPRGNARGGKGGREDRDRTSDRGNGTQRRGFKRDDFGRRVSSSRSASGSPSPRRDTDRRGKSDDKKARRSASRSRSRSRGRGDGGRGRSPPRRDDRDRDRGRWNRSPDRQQRRDDPPRRDGDGERDGRGGGGRGGYGGGEGRPSRWGDRARRCLNLGWLDRASVQCEGCCVRCRCNTASPITITTGR